MRLTGKTIAAMFSTDDLLRLPWNRDPVWNIRIAREMFLGLGYRITEKRGTGKFGRMSTTLPAFKRLLLGHGFKSRPLALQARTMGHEAVHGRQPVSLIRYASARYRLVVEAPAYRESVRIMIAQGASVDAIVRYIEHRVEVMRTTYGVHDDEALCLFRGVLMEDVR